jgi:hypothetical protein
MHVSLKTAKGVAGCVGIARQRYGVVIQAVPPGDRYEGDPFSHTMRTIETQMDLMERQMERAMERMKVEESAENGQRYYREWRQESPHSKTYFSESVTIIRPGSGSVQQHKGNSLGSLPTIAAVGTLVLWYQKSRQFLRVYDRTTFGEEHKWKLVALWPLLYVTSSKFRDEWKRATIDSRHRSDTPVEMVNLDEGRGRSHSDR